MTRQIQYSELARDPAWPFLQSAITFPYTHTKKCDPKTRDGYISVAAIYNLSAWSNWKSSSLGDRERAIADAINGLDLWKLMELNRGRRSNAPALFPDEFGLVPVGGN